MKQRHLKIWLAWAGVLIWCVLCLYLSSQRLADTTRLSAALTHWILGLLSLPGQTWYMPVFDGCGWPPIFWCLRFLRYSCGQPLF